MAAALNVTKLWVSKAITSSVLYGRALCPFANKTVNSTPSKLKLTLSSSSCEDTLLSELKTELGLLFPVDGSSPVHETTLLVVPHMFEKNYRDMIRFSWKIMEAINTDKRYFEKAQVVNFHPHAVTSLMAMEAPEQGHEYAIRAPYPTFHLLRESDLLNVIQNSGYPQPELIPNRNAALLQELGADECKRRFESLRAEAGEDCVENKGQ
jgi:uncharacterized protein